MNRRIEGDGYEAALALALALYPPGRAFVPEDGCLVGRVSIWEPSRNDPRLPTGWGIALVVAPIEALDLAADTVVAASAGEAD